MDPEIRKTWVKSQALPTSKTLRPQVPAFLALILASDGLIPFPRGQYGH